MHLSRYEKNIAYKYYPIFFGIMLSELNYAVSHRRTIPEVLKITFILKNDATLS